jgi:hypothetical protein
LYAWRSTLTARSKKGEKLMKFSNFLTLFP